MSKHDASSTRARALLTAGARFVEAEDMVVHLGIEIAVSIHRQIIMVYGVGCLVDMLVLLIKRPSSIPVRYLQGGRV